MMVEYWWGILQRVWRLILWVGMVAILGTIWHISQWTMVRHLMGRPWRLSIIEYNGLHSWHSKLLGVTKMD